MAIGGDHGSPTLDETLAKRIHAARDIGTWQGHHSSHYKDEVATPSLHEDPIAELPSPSHAEVPTDLTIDPIARELYIPAQYSELLEGLSAETQTPIEPQSQAETFVLSEVVVHEATHALLADREYHYYRPQLLNSFQIPLEFVSANATDETTVETFIRTVLGTIEANVASELVQEAAAIRAQRQFLEKQPGCNDLLDYVNYRSAIDEYSHQEEPPRTLQEYPVHALADWLGDYLDDVWEIDILRHAFRFRWNTENGPKNAGYIYPDQVLINATFAEPERINDRSPEQQRTYLTELVEENEEDRLVDPLWQQNPNQESIGWKDRKIITRDINRDLLEGLIDRQDFEVVPLVATQYPGIESGRTLAEILDSIYVVNEPGIRQLYIESQTYSWAQDTDLLKLAIKLWRLRESYFQPAQRELARYIGYRIDDVKKIVEMVEANQYEKDALSIYDDGLVDAVAEIRGQYTGISDSERFQELVDDLSELGIALVKNDDIMVQRFF